MKTIVRIVTLSLSLMVFAQSSQAAVALYFGLFTEKSFKDIEVGGPGVVSAVLFAIALPLAKEGGDTFNALASMAYILLDEEIPSTHQVALQLGQQYPQIENMEFLAEVSESLVGQYQLNQDSKVVSFVHLPIRIYEQIVEKYPIDTESYYMQDFRQMITTAFSPEQGLSE